LIGFGYQFPDHTSIGLLQKQLLSGNKYLIQKANKIHLKFKKKTSHTVPSMKFLHIQHAIRGGLHWHCSGVGAGLSESLLCNCVTSVWGWLDWGDLDETSGELVDT
jgi:hypothetical protein